MTPYTKEMKPPPATKPRLAYLAAAMALVFFVWCNSAVLVPHRGESKIDDANLHFMAVIDAGSSGSRVHVYQYTSPLSPGTSGDRVRVLPNHATFKQKPGLSSFESHPSDAGSSLESLIVFAKEHVPADKVATTPIMLKATAGLRLVQQKSPEAVASILDSARGVLSGSGFLFKPENAEIISGQEEGKLGWLALNYLVASSTGANLRGGDALWGLLEMGGASVQVSLPVKGASEIPASFILDYTSPTSGRRGSMYTHSFLGLGGEAAQEAIQGSLLEDGRADNPCLPKGFTERLDGADDQGTVVTGTGDYSACTDLMHRTLFTPQESEMAECKKTSPHCFWNGIASPDLSKVQRLWAFENFFYIMSGVGYMKPDETMEFKVGDYARAAKEMCAKDFKDVEAHYPKDTQPKSYNKVWCFSAAYVHAFLTRGLGLDPEQTLMIGNTVGEAGIDWALGAVLQHQD